MNNKIYILLGLCGLTVAVQAAMPACATIDADKKASVYLVDMAGALSAGPLDVGVISTPKDLIVDQAFYPTHFKIITTPKVVEFTDTCGQGICIKLKKIGSACKKSTMYSVKFAITLQGGGHEGPYYLDDLTLNGFKFEADDHGYPAPVDFKFVTKLRGKVVDAP